MSEKAVELYGLGISSVDYLVLMETYPRVNEKTEAVMTSVQGGGPVATALAAAARLDISSAICSVIGQDVEGNIIKEQFRSQNVSIDHLICDPCVRTPKAFIWIEKTSGLRTIVLDKLDSRLPKNSELRHDIIRNAKVFLFDGRGKDMTLTALKTAKTGNVLTVWDAGNVRPDMEEYFDYIDIMIASWDFAYAYTQQQDPNRALHMIRKRFSGEIAITLGERGVIAMQEDTVFAIPAFNVNALDTTGAGDVFHGVFCAEYIRTINHYSFYECLRTAAAAAALSCCSIGGRAGLPDYKSINELLKMNHDQAT